MDLTFSTLHCLLIRNGFGFYVVSFIVALSYQAIRRQLSINVIEFSGHFVLMMIMGRLVYLVVPSSKVSSDVGDSEVPLRGGWDLVSIGFLFCFASNIASFLFGISLGKSMEKDDGTPKGDTEPKNRWLDRRFVIKAKSSSNNKLAGTSGDSPASSSAAAAAGGDSTPRPRTSSQSAIVPTSSPSARSGSAIKLYTKKAGSSEHDSSMNPMEVTINKAKHTILSILNLTDHSRYRDLQLSEIRRVSPPSSNGLVAKLFTTTEKTNGIYLSGSCHTYLSPEAVLRWLKQNSFTTGFEAIAPEQEVSTQSKNRRMEATVRRLVSKPGGIMSSKRDFVVVTSISKLEEAGAYIIASRSMPEDFNNLHNGNGLKKRGGFLRGIVFGCGWILHPWATGDGEDYGCEISFAAHIDMMGAPTSNVNVNKQDLLADRTMEILTYLSSTDDEALLKLEPVQPGGVLSTGGSPSRTSSYPLPAVETEVEVEADLNSTISPENRTTLLAVAKEALDKLRVLHSTYHRPTSRPDSGNWTALSSSAGSGAPKESWDIFYEQNGVSVRELKNKASSAPVGILSAACTTEAPPHVVRQLLMHHPKEVDALLEGRTILAKLDQQSYVQWLAYGNIWPIGAKDFLLATTEDVYDERTGDGFIIASTSVDHLCELEGEVVKGEADDLGEPSYTRSSLKLAGYVGVPNGNGGTDVSLFVDVGVYSYIPAWLLQVLAQYGLSEMMAKIQRSTTGHPQMSFRNDITRMLSRIETTEAKMRSYVQDHNLPVPKDASFLLDDGLGGTGAAAVGRSSMVTPSKGPSSPDAHSRRSLHERASFQQTGSMHLPVPSVQEAQHRRASVRRHSVAAPPGGGIYDEYMPQTQALSDEALHLVKVYLGLKEQQPEESQLALDWKEKKKEKNTVVFGSPVAGSTWNAVRAVSQVRADKADILKLLVDDKRIGEFDDMFDSCKFLFKVGDRVTLRRMAFKAIWPTAPREFLVCSTYEEQPDGSIIVCTRSPEPDLGEDIEGSADGYVRGRLQISGYYIQPYATLQQPGDVPPDGCRVTLTAHSELGGTLPSSVINMLSTAAPMKMLSQIAKILEKKK